MVAFTSILPGLFLAGAVLAKKHTPGPCPIPSDAKVESKGLLPHNTAPLNFITLGVGFQNYTCNATSSTYSNVGAIADIFDISCLLGHELLEQIPDHAMKSWEDTPLGVSPTTSLTKLDKLAPPPIIGDHYFETNPVTGQGISPKWDFIRTNKDNKDAIVFAARSDGKTAPEGKQNIDWVYLTNVKGGLAKEVYRTHTRGGQPPASCKPGSPSLEVRYVSIYWLTGGEVKKSGDDLW